MGGTLAGYGLGYRIPNVDGYLLPIVVVVSLLPVALEMRRERRRARL